MPDRDEDTGPLWDPGPPLGLPPAPRIVHADVCVVGLGGAGLAATRWLLAAGHATVGLDAGRVGGGASGRNGGFLLAGTARFHHDAVRRLGRDRARAIHAATLEELDRLAEAHPTAVRRTGSLRIASDAAELADCEAHLDALRQDGFAAAAYDGPEGRGILLPDDATFDPAATARAEAEAALAAGAVLHETTRVREVGPGQVVHAGGTVHCEAVVIAVDGGLEELRPDLAGRVRTARAQMLATAPVPPRFPRPVYARYGYEYHQQRPDGRVLLGGFRDRGGADEWVHDPVPTAPVQELLERDLRDRLGVRAPITHRWAGSIAFTADDLPVVEAVDDGVVAAGGYSGTGNLIGRLVGRAAAELVVTGRSDLAELLASVEPFDPGGGAVQA